MSPLSIAVLVGAYLFVLFALMGAPVGSRTITRRVSIAAPRDRVWQALYPLGREAGWSRQILEARASGPDTAWLKMAWDGRDGDKITRQLRLEDVEEGRRFASVVIDDSALAHRFWRSFREETVIDGVDGDLTVTITQSDRYVGLAMVLFRYFALRRTAAKLKLWAETARFTEGGAFERPSTQFALAILSMLVLWPLFGMTYPGFVLSAAMTMVVAIHELGHVVAFRVMGHKRVRMIFIPLIGGVAIGGRPHNTRFEVGFSALMGAGFSAYMVPLAMVGAQWAERSGHGTAAASLVAFVACGAAFNLANLVPIQRFDGGQVLRQIFATDRALGLASFAMLLAFLGLGWFAGFPDRVLIIGGAVLSIVGLVTVGGGVAMKHALHPISGRERLAIGLALLATFVIHGVGGLWAFQRILG